MFYSLPFEARKVEATEARLNRIYDAAKLGLKGDSLAMAAGMLPTEYRQLCQLDPIAEVAALKGRADGEIEASRQLHKAAAEGDAKASLAILQHLALPFARATEMLQRRALDAPREQQHHERQRVVLDLGRPQPRHQLLFVFSAVLGGLHLVLA